MALKYEVTKRCLDADSFVHHYALGCHSVLPTVLSSAYINWSLAE